MSFNSLRCRPWRRVLQLHAALPAAQLEPDVRGPRLTKLWQLVDLDDSNMIFKYQACSQTAGPTNTNAIWVGNDDT